MTVPAWAAALAGNTGYAGQINQFLGTHPIVYLYNGATGPSNISGTGTYLTTETTNLAQTFTTSGTYIASVDLSLDFSGSGCDVAFSIQTTSGGAPSGAPVAGPYVIPAEWLTSTDTTFNIPVNATVTNSTLYALVLSFITDQNPNGVDFIQWQKASASSGAYTQPLAGGSWTSVASTSLYYNIYTNGGNVLTGIIEDGGKRIVSLVNTSGPPNPDNIYEFTAYESTYTFNQLSRSDSLFSGIGTWLATNATLSIANKLVITTTSTGIVTVNTPILTNAYIPVSAGVVYSGIGSFSAATTSTLWQAEIQWFNSGGSNISTITGSVVTAVTGSYIQASVTGTAPAGAVFAALKFGSGSQSSGNVNYLIQTAFLNGSATTFCPPGSGVAQARTLTYSGNILLTVA